MRTSDYLYAKNVWSVFSYQVLGNYAHLYLKTDILFITCSLFHYFFKVGGLGCTAENKVELELLTGVLNEEYMVDFRCVHQYAFANNMYMG